MLIAVGLLGLFLFAGGLVVIHKSERASSFAAIQYFTGILMTFDGVLLMALIVMAHS